MRVVMGCDNYARTYWELAYPKAYSAMRYNFGNRVLELPPRRPWFKTISYLFFVISRNFIRHN